MKTIFDPVIQTLAEITFGLIVVALVVGGGVWLWERVRDALWWKP